MSGCSCLFSDVLELLCNIEILRYGMGNNLSHNSIQTAFKISDLALQAITLLIIQRVSNTSYCSYAEHLLPIGSSRIRLLEQTDAQAGSSAHAGRTRTATPDLKVSVRSWDFRITGRAQFLIGTVPGYMNVKYRYTEFQYR